MLILVGVTIATVVDGGLFAKAGVAATQTETEKQNELKLSSGAVTIDGKEYSSIDEYKATLAGTTGGSGTGGDKEYLGMDNEETDSGIGYYVYVDGQYGVIYADLAYDGSGRWGNEDWGYSSYSYEAEDPEKLKKYYKNGTYDPGDEYGTAWGEKPLLVADEELNETEGRTIDRFYVMALTNYTTEDYTTFYWDVNYNGIDFGTSTDFGTGKDNTELLVNTTEVTWADRDIWKNLSNTSVWFVPSRAEWSAFAQEIGITSSYGLSYYYWSSSQYDTNDAWNADFDYGGMNGDSVGLNYSVRLCATF